MINLEEVFDLDTNIQDLILDSFPRKVLLYGAGGLCNFYINLCRINGVEPIVCDSNPEKIGKKIKEITITHYNFDFLNDQELKIIITTPTYYDEIKKQLSNQVNEERYFNCHTNELFKSVYFDQDKYRDFLSNNIERLNKVFNSLEDDNSKKVMLNVIKGNYSCDMVFFNDVYSEDQYFPKGVINLSDDEVFIDGGAYNGDTLLDFIEKSGGNFQKIYSFEPTRTLYQELEILKESLDNHKNKIVLFNKGLFDKSQKVGFTFVQGLTGANHVDDSRNDGESSIEVVGIDEVIDGRVTYIKLDIEGSEIKALQGALKTIKTHKPKLAVCVYHKPEDILLIPEFIMNMGIDYKYYMRHHLQDTNCETVFYAISK